MEEAHWPSESKGPSQTRHRIENAIPGTLAYPGSLQLKTCGLPTWDFNHMLCNTAFFQQYEQDLFVYRKS